MLVSIIFDITAVFREYDNE